MCHTKEMFTSITKKLDKIRELNKNPTVQDYIQAAQQEEEVFERGQLDKLTLNLNHIFQRFFYLNGNIRYYKRVPSRLQNTIEPFSTTYAKIGQLLSENPYRPFLK